MQNELTSLIESSDFVCSYCGMSAFEVEGSLWDHQNTDENGSKEFLLLRCLGCTQLFRHTLHQKEASLILSTQQRHFLHGEDFIGDL